MFVTGGIVEILVDGAIEGDEQTNDLGFVRVTGGILDLRGTITTIGAVIDAVSVGVNGVLYGSGVINGWLTNSGQIYVGGNGATGTFTINGGYTQNVSGQLHIDVSGYGSGEFDKIIVNGAANLGGALNAYWIGAGTPQNNQRIEFMTFNSRNGDFGLFSLNLGNGFYFDPDANQQDYTFITRQSP